MFIINAPFVFSTVWRLIKGWIDEKTQKKISILGSNYYNELNALVDENQIPDFLGGKNNCGFQDDYGPWQEYEVVDSTEPGATVGIRRKDDPNGEVFTADDIMELQNPLIENGGVLGTNGACLKDM